MYMHHFPTMTSFIGPHAPMYSVPMPTIGVPIATPFAPFQVVGPQPATHINSMQAEVFALRMVVAHLQKCYLSTQAALEEEKNKTSTLFELVKKMDNKIVEMTERLDEADTAATMLMLK